MKPTFSRTRFTRLQCIALLTLAACSGADESPSSSQDSGFGHDAQMRLDSSVGHDASTRTDANAPNDANALPDSHMPPDGGGPCTDAPEGVVITELARSAATTNTLGVIAYRVQYASADGTRVQGQMCVPIAPGPFPIIVHVRGGVEGLGVAQWGPIPGNMCHGTASGGAILVEPQLRGSRDQGNNAVLGAIDIASEGVVEFCAGEVDDALTLMRIAQQRCDASPQQVAMWGESHGGCTTLVAASRHPAGLRAAAALVAPVDLVAGYHYNAERSPGGTETPPPGCDAVTDHQYISAGFAALFGTPSSNPSGYTMRSAIHLGAELSSVPLLLVFGGADCLIPVTSQACAMRDALVTAGANVTAYRLDTAGQTTTAELSDCAPMGFQSTWPSSGGFTDNHYIVIGDGQGHQLEGPARSREFDSIRAFFFAHGM